MRLVWPIIVMAACSGDPEPEPPTWNGEGDACLSCHTGIEAVHGPPVDALDCSACHGGDDTALNKEGAHVPVPENWAEIRGDGLPFAPDGYIKDFAPDQLDQLPVDYVRFVNPGDVRAMDRSCGAEGCHPAKVETVRRSIMTTNAGHYMPTLNLAGLQGTLAIYGSTTLVDPECEQDDPIEGSVCELTPLAPPPREDFDQALADGDADALEEIAYEHYLSKSCDTCHAAGYGDNNAPHKYRSTGCTSCHMVYDTNGFYLGDDPSIPSSTPSFPARHEITTNIPTEQCATCHFQGGRIGLLYRGIREAGFSGQLPENAEAWSPGAYGKADPYFYLSDEDTTNFVDETPPDIHFNAGMQCGDCHVGSDVHGDGRIYSTSKQQVDLTCEDCHGTVREPIAADGEGVFRTSSGRPLPQLRLVGSNVVLRGLDGKDHDVTQVAPLVAEAEPGSPLHRSMGIDDDGFSHTDALTCDTCHTSYNQHCIGCHVSMDVRFQQRDAQTGLLSDGLVRGSRETYSLDAVLLGTAPDGRVQTVIASQQVQMAIKDDDGELVLGQSGPEGERDRGVFREVPESTANNGFHVFFQHTTIRVPTNTRPCSTCHPATDSPEEIARVRGVYGFGTGEFMLPGPDGQVVDALQFLDEDGNPLTTWVHEGTGPVPADRRNRALQVFLDEEAP
ncbi:MAG: hypothetical protein AAGA48_17595 [Myxococcota bacterium]